MRIKDLINQDDLNSLDILTNSPYCLFKKLMGTRNENLHFDLGY